MHRPARAAARSSGVAMLCALALTGRLAAQDASHITGRVVESDTRSPIPAVTVTLTGTAVGTQTSDSGRFALRLPPGVTHIKYQVC